MSEHNAGKEHGSETKHSGDAVQRNKTQSGAPCQSAVAKLSVWAGRFRRVYYSGLAERSSKAEWCSGTLE